MVRTRGNEQLRLALVVSLFMILLAGVSSFGFAHTIARDGLGLVRGRHWFTRLRGGHAEEPGGGDHVLSNGDSDDSDSCGWFKQPEPGDGTPLPRLDTDHAPWLDSYRQVFFEAKLHNRTLIQAYQESGKPPPLAHLTPNVSDDPLVPRESDADGKFREEWEQYWAEWEEEWGEPQDSGADIAQIRYKMPYITGDPPEIALRTISVDEKPIFTARLFPDSIPLGWPKALRDVLHSRYDDVKHNMELNLALLEAASEGNIEAAVQLLRDGALIHTGDSSNPHSTYPDVS
jgi:hypothetical protein